MRTSTLALTIPHFLKKRPLSLALAGILSAAACGQAQNQVLIDHHFTNTDAQSMIGLPMGSHKTIVDKQGNLKWSQWSLKRRELDSPIGFSSQMDGALVMQVVAMPADGVAANFVVDSQRLYRNRYPFVVTALHAEGLTLEETAFAADPEAKTDALPGPDSGAHALDLVRLTFTNTTDHEQRVQLKLSGRERNLPGHVEARVLITHSGEDVALLEGVTETTSEDDGLTLAASLQLPAHASKVLWVRLPYEWPSANNSALTKLTNEQLFDKAAAQWDSIWSRGTQIELPQQDLNDFYRASLAYVMMLTEYDGHGDLWVLDGPAVYRQYWGRGEYFQARALEVAGYMSPARESVEHALHIENDDGEWDGPPASGWPAWDNSGGNVASVWEYYQYTHDKQWLARAYPAMLEASKWIRDHREETTLEDVTSVPKGAQPIRRMISSKCRTEPQPALQLGEHTYWYGLLPWSYGDSGLPEGHSYSHNFLAAYAVQVTEDAAKILGHTEDAAWLHQEFASYKAAIQDSVRRSVTLEKTSPPYLPAMPTYPEGAYSQTFLAVFPTELYSPEDPLVTGLLTRMEREEKQGLPTNVAWAGSAGVWPGEAMNMAETYLLRGDVQKTADMLLAAVSHSYTTDAFKEEILIDVTQPRACDTPHSKRDNMEGTGDQPEAWGSANYVDLLRDMLLQERDDRVHLLAGLPAAWLARGQTIRVSNAPVTTGGTVSYTVEYKTPKLIAMRLNATAPMNFAVHLPVPDQQVSAVRVDGKPISERGTILLNAANSTTIEVELK